MRTTSSAAKKVVLQLVIALFFSHVVRAEEIRVLTSGAFTSAYLALAPEFERATRHKLVTVTTSMGFGTDSIPSRLQRGEPADVVILPAATIDDLIAKGLVSAGGRVDLARSAIGMAVRAGARKPDISSVDALKRTLLEAKSIAYSASVSGTYLSTELFQHLGIADQVKGKTQRIERERVGGVVARGEAEIGFQQISELLPVPGIEIVGPLPAELQKITVFSAGIATVSKEPEAGKALIKFLASPAASAAIVKSGLEPIPAGATN
jgi:molybdate transport system substrate-binding protein